MEWLLLLVLPIAFPLVWILGLRLLSNLGGWANLARQYPAGADEKGVARYLCSGSVGIVNYGSCLTIRVCPRGLRLSVLFPFRVGHPPLFIPWDQFQNAHEQQVFLRRFLAADIGQPKHASVKLPIWVRDYLLAAK